MPLEEIVAIEGPPQIQGMTKVEGRWLAVANRPVTFTVELNSIFSRDIGGELLLEDEAGAVLATFTEHLELARGAQSFSGSGMFTEPGEYREVALVWQPETDEPWRLLGDPLPAIKVVSNVTATVVSGGGRIRAEPDTDSAEIVRLAAGDVVQLIGQRVLDDSIWLKVLTREGVVGWMSAEVLEFDEKSLVDVQTVE